MLDNITVNAHSSIRIDDKVIAYIDPFRLTEERHDADLILFTHPHFDHFSPEDFRKAAKEDTIYVCPLSMKAEALLASAAWASSAMRSVSVFSVPSKVSSLSRARMLAR